MVAVRRIAIYIVDHHRRAMLADFVAYGGPDFEFSARFQPEVDLVAHAAGNPAILGYSRYCCKTHTRRLADHF